MRQYGKWIGLVLWGIVFLGCSRVGFDSSSEQGYVDEPNWDNGDDDNADGTGGSSSDLTLPFPEDEVWQLTRAYNTGSHMDYGYDWVDDRYALDFADGGCDSWRKPIRPIRNGTVELVAYDDDGYGHYVLVDHGDGYKSRYAHFDEAQVVAGQNVTTDTVIGLCGNSGYVLGTACPEHPGTHLHIAYYLNGEAALPEPMSGHTNFTEDCWYGHHGWVDCDGDDVDDTDDDSVSDDDSTEEDPGDDDSVGDDDVADDDDPTGDDDTTPVDPCTFTVPLDTSTIQAAIDLSVSGDMVCVEAGDYFEDIAFVGEDIVVRGISGPEQTHLYGMGGDPTVLIGAGQTAATVFEGFTVHGAGSRSVYEQFGAATLRDLVIDCSSSTYGISFYYSTDAVVERVQISECSYYGMTLYHSPNAVIQNVILSENVHTGLRAGDDSSFTLTNSVVYDNGTYGVRVSNADGVVQNSIIAVHDTYGLHLEDPSYTLVSRYNTLHDHGTGSYGEHVAIETGNATEDPLFADPENGDFSLQTGSPCVDAGDPDAAMNDPDGTRNDKGAHGGPSSF